MILVNDPTDAPRGPKVLAVGSFDGLHLGHRHLLQHARHAARTAGQALLIYTFDPPSKVFMRGAGMLSTLSEKISQLEDLGIDIALIVPFNAQFAARSKNAFLDDLRTLQAKRIFVGTDFRFGKGREGAPEDLLKVAPVEIVPLLSLQDQVVKSSQVRVLIEQGKVEEARHLLDRPYSARGVVVEGDRRGRLLGFPTANLEVSPAKVLPPGVFVVMADVLKRNYHGMANVGTRPTVSGKERRIEVHLFGFSGQLYGQTMGLAFHKYLRAEQRFEDLEALKAQLARDAVAARSYFNI